MSGCPFTSRRGLLGAGAGGLAALAAALPRRAAASLEPSRAENHDVVPFYGTWQGGILTDIQSSTVFAALDLTARTRAEVVALLKAWTEAAARMTQGEPAAAPLADRMLAPSDSGDANGLAPSRLTITIGFGPGLFAKDGKDRYGLAARRPAALADLPEFNGDQMIEGQTGGDLSIQACADDPQVAFHAVRNLVRLAEGAATTRWMHAGYSPQFRNDETPRNLMGFKDGTQNPILPAPVADAAKTTRPLLDPARVLWADTADAPWMQGGTYCVFRRIRISLEHWDRTDLDFQEQVVGRRKVSGAPLGAEGEWAPLDLDAVDEDGNPVIPEDAHVRLAAASRNDGAEILRRPYSYNSGVTFLAERWPPWRQGIMMDAGLLFVCYQRDPRTGFSKIFEPMSKLDAMNQFTTHVGSALFAVPGAARPGGYVGEALLAG
jgi:deferrochelatase/peroxidase EfeB